jgi:hypothetical protein
MAKLFLQHREIHHYSWARCTSDSSVDVVRGELQNRSTERVSVFSSSIRTVGLRGVPKGFFAMCQNLPLFQGFRLVGRVFSKYLVTWITLWPQLTIPLIRTLIVIPGTHYTNTVRLPHLSNWSNSPPKPMFCSTKLWRATVREILVPPFKRP